MKKITIVLLTALLFAAVAPLSAQEPAHDLEGVISPEQSWILHANEVWALALDANLKIASVEGPAKVEIEEREFVFAGEMAVPEDNPDVPGRRIKPLDDSKVYIWATVGKHEIHGWAPKNGVAVVKTGPLGAQGPPPPGNATPVPPEPTPVPPELVMPSFGINEAGHLTMTMGEETIELGRVTGQPGTGPSVEEVVNALKADEGFLGSITQDPVIDYEALAAILKSDQAFVESLQGKQGVEGQQGLPGAEPSVEDIVSALRTDEEFLNSITPDSVVDHEALAAILKGDQAFVESLDGPEGPPGPVGITDLGFVLLLLLAVVGILVGLSGWWVNRGAVGEILEALEKWQEALEGRVSTTAFDETVQRIDEALGQRATTVALDEFKSRVNQELSILQDEIAPLRPQPVVFDTGGKPRCPGCNLFVKRIPAEIAGRCGKCGVAYVIPTAEEIVAEEVIEEREDLDIPAFLGD